ncbi:DNA-directed RNA polymerase I subunit RPA34-like [Anneissia japonica]|uniref:DNA-directed RNA polymerase I subunit RPA34-like n=1 Tax=Anneissia japonica TaxID=1529436 RepID=UPI0014257E89|nr:DNA-directed RNA polymerase I subunit RPA34-like [Anneissia japonica]
MSRHTPKKRKKHDSTSSSSDGESTNFNPVEEEIPSTTDKFVCPDKFQKIKPTYDTLCLEDVKGNTNKELWLIRAPLNFDCSLLDGQKCIPNAQYKLGDDTQFEAIVKETKQVGNITAVLPSKKKKKLLPGPAFKGLISVVSRVEVAPVDIPMSPPKMSFDIPTGLQQRYTPFGCGSPLKKRKRKRKRRNEKEEDERFKDSVIRVKEEKEDILDTSSSKKKKRKKDKRNTKPEEVEMNIREETESEENGVIIPPTEIKKENYIDEVDFIISNIKQEPEEMDGDELNLIRKSTKKKKKKKHKDD